MVSGIQQWSHWVQNIQRNPHVPFEVGRATFNATGRIVDEATEPALVKAVSERMVAKYGWSDGWIVELTPSREEAQDGE